MRKSCIVVSNSPPFGLPSRECADDYLDKTVEQLAEEMGQKVKKKPALYLFWNNPLQSIRSIKKIVRVVLFGNFSNGNVCSFHVNFFVPSFFH